MRFFLDILVFLPEASFSIITKKQYINRQGLLLSVSRVNFDCRHYELHDIIMCRNARDIFRVSVYSTFNTNINILRKTRRYDRPFKWFVLKFTLHVRENHFLIVMRYFVLKMIEGPKFVIAVTLKKYYKEVTKCTIEYYFVRNNKGTNNKERINFRSSSGTYLVYSWLYR